jgi:glycine betaine transporter
LSASPTAAEIETTRSVSYAAFALLLIAIFTAPVTVSHVLRDFTGWFQQSLGWLVIVLTTGFLLLCIGLALSRYGKIVLGREGDLPEYSRLSWFAMLFAAGMGSGLAFWGTAEPLTHLLNAPPFSHSDAPDDARMIQALMVTYIHWAVHPWAIYAICALTTAYFSFRHDRPLLPSSAITFSSQGKVSIILKECVEIIAIAAVVFGVVATLSMGTLQVARGLRDLLDLEQSIAVLQQQAVFVFAAVYILSACTKLGQGIKFLSNFNMLLCLVLLLFIWFFGQAGETITLLFKSVLSYLQHGLSYPLAMISQPEAQKWQQDWTISYYLWWIAWGPFVGVFIARISRGRTIREFIVGIIILPSLFSVLWFSVMGGNAMLLQLSGVLDFSMVIEKDYAHAAYLLLQAFPFTEAMQWLTLVLSFIFVVTGTDSAAYVLGIFSNRGRHDPPVRVRFFWGAIITIITWCALQAGNQVEAIRLIAAVGAVPFLFIMLWQLWAFVRQLRKELPQ